jgi:O-antigen/teichoic acid export membrane protein
VFDKKRYLRNILLNWGAYFTSLAVGFLIAPMVVRGLGDAHYGYWTLVLTATSYFARLDFGIQSAVAQYISRHLADQDKEQLNDKATAALSVLLVIGFAAFLFCLWATSLFTGFFNVPAGAAPSVRTALIFMGTAAAAKLPFSVFQAMLVGKERFDIMSGISMGGRIVNAVLIFVLLNSQRGLVGLSAALACTQMAEGMLLIHFARRAVPEFRFRPFRFKAAAIGELYRYGAFNFLINIASQFGNGFWAFLLARRLGADSVTYFSIGYEVIPYMVGVANAATLPLLQSIIPMDVKEDAASIRKMFITGSRYFFSLICIMGVNLLLVGESFIGRWMGEKYLDPNPYGSSGAVLIVLTIANLASLSSSVAQQILFARRKNRTFAYLTLAQTACIIGLSLVLAPRFGIVGMAVAMLIPLVCIEGILIPTLAGRYSHATMGEYWGRAILPNLAVAAIVFAAGKLVLPLIPGAGWPPPPPPSALVSLLHLAGVVAFILEKKDRIGFLALIRARFAAGITGVDP